MRFQYCTITGADDTTNIDELIALHQEFRFVEFGILVSKSQEGNKRFPSRDWTKAFAVAVQRSGSMNVSLHLCGAWMRQLLLGKLAWTELPVELLGVARRIQLNTHAETNATTFAFYRNLESAARFREVIFQIEGVNDHLFHAARDLSLNVSGLFDKSGGAGILPESWPRPQSRLWKSGFAGGLGPKNIRSEFPKIVAAVSGAAFWIDMERNVRTEDDGALDIAKVREVLVAVKDMACE